MGRVISSTGALSTSEASRRGRCDSHPRPTRDRWMDTTHRRRTGWKMFTSKVLPGASVKEAPDTHWKFNEPDNHWVVEENSLPKVHFQVPC